MSLVGGASALAVALVLLAAGLGHLRDRPGLVRALAAHGVLPSGVRRVVAAVLGPAELVLGLALVVTGLLPGPAPLPTLALVAAGASLLLAAFTTYLLVVLRRTRGQGELPCGCGLGAAPVGPWAVLRAGLLTALALVVLGWAGSGGDAVIAAAAGVPVAAQWFVVLAAGLSLAIASAALPAARAVPPGLTALHGGRR